MEERIPAVPYVRWAGITIAEAGDHTPARRLYDHEITYVLSGEGEITFDSGAPHHAGPNDCFLVPPRVPHTSRNSCDAPWVTLGIHFDWTQDDIARFPHFRADDGKTETDETLFRDARGLPGWSYNERPVIGFSSRPLTRHFLEETQTAFARFDSISKIQAGALLLTSFLQIQRELSLMADGRNGRAVGPDAQRRLNDARWLLEQTGTEALSVAQVAQRVDWSVDYLSYMVRTAWGITPRQFQNQARLRRARQLLAEGLAVAEVARQCGFADTSHLARAFRKDSGLTPREYSALNSLKKTESS